MAEISPGRPGRPFRRPNKQSTSSNTHRFEPFSKRIARLKIDPVHRVQQNDPLQEETGLLETHFGLSLTHWAELNLSANFAAFLRKVKPLSENLPQILHHADSIFTSLVHHIGEHDSASAEPLLSLLAHFAHDLGPRFEKYFAEAVSLVLSVAAIHDGSEVIEWSFSCLAWMLKYLSRLLVPDLRPLLTIMAPYLGRTRQKSYVTRFAAESLAYLIRMAGVMYQKSKSPLEYVVSYLFEDLRGVQIDKEKSLYQIGLMSLFSEAMVGIDGGLHSSSTAIAGCLIDHAKVLENTDDPCLQVLEGVIISSVHETDSKGFKPLAKLVQDFNHSLNVSSPPYGIALGARLLFIIVATRKGSRISDWTENLDALIHISQITAGSSCPFHATTHQVITTIIAMAFQYSPLDAMLPFNTRFTDLVTSGPLSKYFLSFCLFSDQIGRDRFQSLLLPHLQQYIVREWQHNQLRLCLLVRRLSATGLKLSLASSFSGCLASPSHLEDDLLRSFCTDDDRSTSRHVSKDALAQFAEDMSLPKDSDLAAKYVEPLRSKVAKAFRRDSPLDVVRLKFETGRAFKSYVRLGKLTGKLDNSIWSVIASDPAPPTSCPVFLAALLQYVNALELAESELSRARTLLTHLITNLLRPAGAVKTLSVRLMQQIITQKEAQNTLSTVLQLLEIPYGLQTVRQITMFIRQLVITQKNMRFDTLLQKIVPYLCLGLLASKSAPIAQEVYSAISALCEDLTDEGSVCDVVVKWLQTAGIDSASREPFGNEDVSTAKPSRHQCSNVEMVDSLAQKAFDLFDDPQRNLEKCLSDAEATSENLQSPMMRLQALQVFNSIPHVAEKRSRFLVPIFLSIKPAHDYLSLPLDPDASTSSHTMSPEILTTTWTFLERKAFLELLGKFTNPKVLFKAQEVSEALLDLLTVGQSEIQRLALKALFTWKLSSIRKYEENLLKLTDEKTYREELTTLFHADVDSSPIQDEDRSQLLPILLRILYGQMVNRSGSKANHGGQEAKRKTTLRTLFRMQHDEITQFLDIAFGKISVNHNGDSKFQDDSSSLDLIEIEKQYGIVRAAESMLETLQSQLAPFADKILQPVLYCLYRVCRRLNKTETSDNASELQAPFAMARSIRRTALHCICMLSTCCKSIQWSSHLPSLFEYVITPRLGNFALENAQGVSGLLHLFATWSDDPRAVSFLHVYNDSLLDKVADCLINPSTKDDVKVFVLEQLFLNLPRLAAQNSDSRETILSVLQSHMQHLLQVLGLLLVGKVNQKVLDPAVALLASLVTFVDSSIDVGSLVTAISTSLAEPPNRVSPRIKGNLLQAVLYLMKLHPSDMKSLPPTGLRSTVCSLFSYFKDAPNRNALAEVLEALSTDDSQAREVAILCSRLNAVSCQKLDEPDYDSRLEAFNTINEKDVGDLSSELWEPIVQNLLYFARAADDFAIRSNAVSSLRRFISDASELRTPAFDALLQGLVLEALRKATKADSESVRADHVALFGLLIQKYPNWVELSDMRGLLAGSDEEASFFSNILHIQHHRRIRAMRRLATEAERGVLRSTNICKFFLPLLEKFIFDSKDDESIRNLRGQAISTVGGLLQWVEWSQFRAIFRRYKSYMNIKPESEKDVIKLLGVTADALVRSALPKSRHQDTDMNDALPDKSQTALAKSLPNLQILFQELTTHLIPDLASFIHQKDESQITSRVPVAVTTVKLLTILPQAQMAQFLPPLLLDIAYILRSRSQDSRDMARRTLAEAISILGPSCMNWVLKELRTALARGYQLHVLSYTVHSILVSNTDNLKPGDLDHCLEGLVGVVMDDIFGAVGQEKDAEDYISKMREIKSSKSLDSMELLAKSTSIPHLINLVRPLRTLLTGTVDSKQARKIDEVLRRIGVGLSRNPVAGSQDMLTFCYQIIHELYREKSITVGKPMTNDEENRQRFLVQLSGANKAHSSTNASSMYKLAKFALDVLRSTLQKHDSLLTPENVHGFLPVIGDALVQAQEDVKISAMRILSAVIKLPMSELEESAGLYTIEAVKVIKDSSNTNGEAAQAALKLIAAILRERRSVRIRDSDLSYLLHRVMPDLEEPDRQGVTFNFVKAVMARKIMLPEVYDASRKIGMIMVTDHGRSARDAARGIFVYFLIEFPQSKERWNKQLKFLVKNLSYQYPEGRQSIMEAVHMLLKKAGNTVAQELIGKVFIPLVLIMANDDDAECRQMAGALLCRCFELADRELLKSLLDSLRGWVQQSDNPTLSKTGMQAFKILFEVPNIKAEKEVPVLLSAIHQQIKKDNEWDETWETLHHALQLFSKITAVFPALSITEQQNHTWSRIRVLLTHPHPWIHSSAASLIGLWFHDLAITNGKTSLAKVPLVGSHGLELTASAQLTTLASSLRLLKRNSSSKNLSAQIVRNLVFLGRCFIASGILVITAETTGQSEKESQDEGNESSESDQELNTPSKHHKVPAITHLLNQLSSILRREPRKLTTSALLPKQSSIQLLAALTHHTPPTTLLPLLPHTLLPPLAHLTDPSLPTPLSPTDTTFATAYHDLTTSAAELLDLLQKKVGSADYVRAMTEAQRGMRERREGRRVKRKVEAVRDPEAAAREKRRRVEKEKRRKGGKREGFRRGRRGE